jgi:hypothetical protein
MKFGDVQEHGVQMDISSDRALLSMAMRVKCLMGYDYGRRIQTHQNICCLHDQGAL